VLEVPEHPDMVLKVVPHLYDPYRAYVDFVMSTKHALDPKVAAFLPVIHYVEVTSDGIMLVFMEKLNSLTVEEWSESPSLRHVRYTLDHGAIHNGDYDKAAMALHELLTSHMPCGAWMDLHGKNVMMRDDGQLVVTDPYAGNELNEFSLSPESESQPESTDY
jgi:hypothetical protein